MLTNDCPISARIWNSDDQMNSTVHPVGHCYPLQLSRAQLGLEVQQRGLDLHLHDLGGGL
jgi:hypothetical protein